MHFSIFSIVVLLSQVALAKTIVRTVYGRAADITVMEKLVKMTDLTEIVRIIESHKVKIYKVAPDKPSDEEATFNFLPAPPIGQLPDLIPKIADVDSGSALFTTRDGVQGAATNIILLASDAKPMTLLHEFIHHLIEVQNHAETEKITKAQLESESILRRFNFKTRKVMMDNSLLISKQWRDEIKVVSEEYTSTINSSQGSIGAEEVATETVMLKLLIKQKSPHLDLVRAEKGINNYATGLTTQSEGLVRNIFALNDLIVTEGMNQDPETSDLERKDWQKRRSIIEKKLNTYLNGPIAAMRAQIKSVQHLLPPKN